MERARLKRASCLFLPGVLMLFSACTPEEPTSEERDWGPLAVTLDDDPDTFSEAGGGLGTLSISDRCVAQSGGEDEVTWTLVWRSGQTSWDSEAEAILFEDPEGGEKRLRGGEVVQVFGSPGVVEEGDVPDWLVEPDESCPAPLLEAHSIRIILDAEEEEEFAFVDRDELEACEPLAPDELIDGSAPGEPAQLEHVRQRVAWGEGEARLEQSAGLAALAMLGAERIEQLGYMDRNVSESVEGDELVIVGGQPRMIGSAEDPPAGEVTIELWHKGCPYVNRVAAGHGIEDIRAYAERF